MVLRNKRDIIANFKTKYVSFRAWYKAFIIWFNKSVVGDLISRYEVEEYFWVGLCYSGKDGEIDEDSEDGARFYVLSRRFKTYKGISGG